MINYTKVMEDWVQANRKNEPLYPRLEFHVSPADWDKQSAWVVFDHPNALGQVITWETGECEVEFGSLVEDGVGDVIRSTHVTAPTQLVSLLDEVLALVMRDHG